MPNFQLKIGIKFWYKLASPALVYTVHPEF